MAITLRLPPSGSLGHVGFAYSPALEATLSLRSVLNPKRYPMYLPWTRRTRELSVELREEIKALAFTFRDNVLGLFEIGLSGDFPSFDDELAHLSTCDHDRVVYELSEPFGGWSCADPEDPSVVHDPVFQARILDRARSADPIAAEILEVAFRDPSAVRERIARMLKRYWDEAFHEEWARIHPLLEAEVGNMALALMSGGMSELIQQFLPEVRYRAEPPALSIERPYARDVDVAERGGLAFVPYVYDFRIMVEMDPPWGLAIFLPLRAMRQPEVPTDSDRQVAAGLRALGDETRIQIMRLIGESPRSTKELAQLLSVSDSAVSRHLKILADVGVVDSSRDGYYVLYRLRPERIGLLGTSLRHTLGLGTKEARTTPPRPIGVRSEEEVRPPRDESYGA